MISALILAAGLIGAAPGTTALDMAQRAFDDGQPAEVAVAQLIEFGVSPERATAAVGWRYGDCESVYSAVFEAVLQRPAAAEAIVSSASNLPNCACTGETLWSLTRVHQRVRPSSSAIPVPIADACGCAAIAVEAAISAAPTQAAAILRSAVDRVEIEPVTVDLMRVPVQETQTWFRQSCDTRTEWGPRPVDLDCAAGLLLTQVNQASGGTARAVIRNFYDDDIDLAEGEFQLAVTSSEVFDDVFRAPLIGQVRAGREFTVMTRAEVQPAGVAQQAIQFLTILPGDVVRLERAADDEACDCAEPLVAAAFRARTPEQERDWSLETVTSTYAQVEQLFGDAPARANGILLDSIGQLAGQERSARPVPTALRRRSDACSPDPNPRDEFAWQVAWLESEPAGLLGLGEYNGECDAYDAVLSELVIGQNGISVVEIYNPTPGQIDLSDGYILEVYEDSDDQPDQVIPLNGELPAQKTVLVANAEVRHSAQALINSESLTLSPQSVVLLKRRVPTAALQCNAQVAAANTELYGRLQQSIAALGDDKLMPVGFTPTPYKPPSIGEPVEPPVRVQPVASPNE